MALIIIGANPILFTKAPSLLLMVLSILTIGFPLIAVVLMKWLDLISSFEMKDAKERFIPMIAIATFWLWAFFMFKPGSTTITSSNALLSNMLLGSVLSVFIAFPFNSLQKISFHAIGMGGLVGLFINIIPYSSYNLIGFFLIAILLAGLVGTARLYLKEHTLSEIFGGFLIGFMCQFLAYQFYDRIAHLFQF